MLRAALPTAEPGAAPGPASALRRLGPAGELAATLAAGTALSWLLTGHVFGHSNNVFHLPIVAGLAAQPGFAGEAFVQSLAGFASGLWMLLQGSDASWPAPVLFAIGLAASKALTLLGAVAVARTLGLAGRWRTLAFVGALAGTPLLLGTAYAGHGGLFVDYFSHSELANGMTLLVWWASLRQRHGLALALNGGVCFLNAFMAAWNVVPWLWLLLADRRERRWAWRAHGPALAAGLAMALLWSAPVLWRLGWAGIAGDAASGGPGGGVVVAPAAGTAAAVPEVDLREFVRGHYPYHFLASEMPLAQWLGLAAVLAAAFAGLHWLGPAAAGLRRLLLAYGAVYAAGVVLPLASDASVLIRLHLLRSSVHFHFVAAIALALVLVQPAAGRTLRRAAVAVALLTARPAVVIALVVAMAERLAGRSMPWPLARRAAVLPAAQLPAAEQRALTMPAATRPAAIAAPVAAIVIAAWQVTAVPARLAHTRSLLDSGRHWQALALRIGELTPPGASVLLPLDTGSWQPPDAGSGVFEYASGRSVWVDEKRGAAVLWQPSLLASWRARRDEVARLRGWPERVRYAADKGVAMVVGRCDELPPTWVPEVRAGALCALRAAAPAPKP